MLDDTLFDLCLLGISSFTMFFFGPYGIVFFLIILAIVVADYYQYAYYYQHYPDADQYREQIEAKT